MSLSTLIGKTLRHFIFNRTISLLTLTTHVTIISEYRLNNEFLSDPWITYRFRKYMAGPKRWGWKNQREIKRQYQFTFLTNAVIGGLLTAPFAVWIARRAQHYQGGVPIVPYHRWNHDFPNVDPGHLTRKKFRLYFFGTCILGGVLFANATLHGNQKRDAWYSRPDLKPFPAMVPKGSLDITERTALEAHYQSFRNKQYEENKKTRTWYRLFFPNDADYSVKQNPYSQTHRENVYNPANNYYARPSNHFRHHVNE